MYDHIPLTPNIFEGKHIVIKHKYQDYIYIYDSFTYVYNCGQCTSHSTLKRDDNGQKAGNRLAQKLVDI